MTTVNTHALYVQNHRTNDNGIVERKCQEWLEESYDNYYYVNKKDVNKKFLPECRKCTVKRSSKNQAENKDRASATQKAWKDERRDELHDAFRAWKKSVIGHIRRYQRGYQQSSKGKSKYKVYGLKRYFEKNHDISSKEWIACKDYFKDKDGDWSCAYCGLKIQDHLIDRAGNLVKSDFHKEHNNDKGSNDLSNCIPSCGSCNYKKWSFPFEEWYRNYEYFNEDRYDKIIKWIEEDYKFYIEDKPPYRIRKKKNKDNNKFHHELWTVDKYRNMIECIAIADKKKDLHTFIQKYFNVA